MKNIDKQKRLILIKELIAKHQPDLFFGLSTHNFDEEALADELNVNDDVLIDYLSFYQDESQADNDETTVNKYINEEKKIKLNIK